MRSSLLTEKPLLIEKSKAEEIPLVKKKKKKKELYASVHISNKEVIVKPKFATHNVKNKVSFYLCKYQP